MLVGGGVAGVVIGAAIGISALTHAQEATTTPVVASDTQTLSTPASVEGLNVQPDGTPIDIKAPVLDLANLSLNAVAMVKEASENKLASGASADRANFTYLMGKLDYMTRQLDQLQNLCGKR